MIDWTAFENACAARERPAILAAACDRAWQWLDLDAEQRGALLEDAIALPDDARTMQQALDILRRRVARDAKGREPPEHDRASRADAIQAMQQVVAARVAQVSASEDEERGRLLAVTGDVSAAMERAGGPFVDEAAYDGLRQAADALAQAGVSMGPAVAREHAWWMGLAHWGLGTAAQALGRFQDAHDALERAARHYDAAGEPDQAIQCRAAARALTHRLRGDIDAASLPDVRAQLSDLPNVERAATLARLSQEAGKAGDRYGAARLGEQVAQVLGEDGYGDPEPDVDAACQTWLDVASTGRHGADPFKRVCDLVEQWAVVLSARINEQLGSGGGSSEASERAFKAVTTEFLPMLVQHAELARAAAGERLAAWDPQVVPVAEAPRLDVPNDAATVQAMNDELYALRIACNRDPQPLLLDEADRLLAQAEARGSRVHAASALIERAYILNALGRPEEVPAAADAAIERLLDGRPATLGSFTTGFERDLYLMAVSYKARAAAARRDHDGILAACVPALRDLESERRRVNAPYQQSASLGSRTEIYEMVAVAAWRTEDWDLLLDTTERLKARASLASRLRVREDEGRPGAESEALREWRAVNDALRATPSDTSEWTALRERRRWLSTIVAIERATEAGVPEALTVADVQAALSFDEAAISWFWLGTDALIIQAFTSDARDAVVYALEPATATNLQEFLKALDTLADDDADLDRFERLIDSLGDALLPARIRELVAGRSRLILCPHRTLHLFPFHAVPWRADGQDGRLIQQVAVRCVPNLTSLLLPWHGTTQGRVLSVGVGEFDHLPDWPLPGAEAEAAAVAGAHEVKGDVLPGPDRATFLARVDAGGFRCLHLATHGSSVLADDAANDPLESSLSLRDGDLSAWDLAALDLRVELVSLAACHSGQRAVAGRGMASLPGDDLFGLQAVLFEAGVWGVLGALWPVDDETSIEIMTGVHRAYARGASPDVALHEATRAYLAKPGQLTNVCYWAPFILTTLGRHPS